MAASQEARDRVDQGHLAIDPDEIEKFDAFAEDWWDPKGPMAPLHRQGPARLAFLREALTPLSKEGPQSLTPLKGLSLLDLGCGAGLVSEALARLGAKVTAVDASPQAIEAAKAHAEESGIQIDYRNCSAETLMEAGESFDAVVSLEVIEHVPEPAAFIELAAGLVRPGGVLAISTLNRTTKSFAMAIVGAEYLLRWLPRGTHSWRRFLKPSEVGRFMRHAGFKVTLAKGIVYNPLDQAWRLSARDLDVNYILAGRKVS